jgi:hypothetical protein
VDLKILRSELNLCASRYSSRIHQQEEKNEFRYAKARFDFVPSMRENEISSLHLFLEDSKKQKIKFGNAVDVIVGLAQYPRRST